MTLKVGIEFNSIDPVSEEEWLHKYPFWLWELTVLQNQQLEFDNGNGCT